ncbi:uncharacterized protein V6R79_012414 [Siganus canaliculatus]
MMKKLFLLLLFCHTSSSVKHSLKYFFTGLSGVPNFPEFMAAAVVNNIPVVHCDTHKKMIMPKQDWVKNVLENDPQQMELYTGGCVSEPSLFRDTIWGLKQRFNQSGGVHILQRMYGCEWDDETGEVKGFHQYGYNGEDLLSLDLKTLTWITPESQAIPFKMGSYADNAGLKETEMFLTQVFPEWLRKYLTYGKSSLLRTDLPSVSLLQKTPSSPVRCFATGFYPDRAMMFWRKDGVEIHEDVEHGEILPNQDGTFQMSVDLDASSVTADDWGRFDCVFQLSGVKEDVVTRLEREKIRTNFLESSSGSAAVIGVFVGLLLVFAFAVGLIIIRRRN